MPRWRLPVVWAKLSDMDTTKVDPGQTPVPETEADRQHRIAWEAEMIAEADADIAAGRLVDEAEVDA
jgi:hypothetical protein